MLKGNDQWGRSGNIRSIALIYAASHFLVDFACAFFVWRFVWNDPNGNNAVLLYNFCAFALQMPMGLLVDRFGNGKVFSALGCLVVAVASIFRVNSVILCLIAGLGNALFHIGGGHDVLRQSEGKAGWLGLFVSPGAFGLFLGGWLAGQTFPVWPVPVALVLFAAMILLLCPRVTCAMADPAVNQAPRPWVVGMILLFLVVCLRSYGGFIFQFSWKEGIWSWLFVLSVVFGKTVGGWLYDRMGGIRATVASLGLAAALFLGSTNAVMGCLAVLLFNITMPITLRIMADWLPDKPAFSFGLLTFALFLGYLPIWFGWPAPSGTGAYAGICLVSLALLMPVTLRRCK